MSKDLLDYPFCHDVNKYERMVKIGQGTFGFVDCFSPPFWSFDFVVYFKNCFAARCSRHATERILKKSLPSRRSSWTTRKKGYIPIIVVNEWFAKCSSFRACFLVTELLVFFAPLFSSRSPPSEKLRYFSCWNMKMWSTCWKFVERKVSWSFSCPATGCWNNSATSILFMDVTA